MTAWRRARPSPTRLTPSADSARGGATQWRGRGRAHRRRGAGDRGGRRRRRSARQATTYRVASRRARATSTRCRTASPPIEPVSPGDGRLPGERHRRVGGGRRRRHRHRRSTARVARHRRRSTQALAQQAGRARAGAARPRPRRSDGESSSCRDRRSVGGSAARRARRARIVLTAATTCPSDADLAAAQQAVLASASTTSTPRSDIAATRVEQRGHVCASVGTPPPRQPPPDPRSVVHATSPALRHAAADEPHARARPRSSDAHRADRGEHALQTALPNASCCDSRPLSTSSALPPDGHRLRRPPPPTRPPTSPAPRARPVGAGPVRPGVAARVHVASVSPSAPGTGRRGVGASRHRRRPISRRTRRRSTRPRRDVDRRRAGADQATIASPIDGTVVAVNPERRLTSVTAASSTANVDRAGRRRLRGESTVSVDACPHSRSASAPRVVPDGSHKAARRDGRLISVVPDAQQHEHAATWS